MVSIATFLCKVGYKQCKYVCGKRAYLPSTSRRTAERNGVTLALNMIEAGESERFTGPGRDGHDLGPNSACVLAGASSLELV
jgi:hypothetical protein